MLSIVAAIGGFIPSLFGKKLAFKTAKIVGFVVLAIIAAGLIKLGIMGYNASIIDEYKVEQRAETAEATLEADRKADAEAAAIATDLAQTEAELAEAIARAKMQNPVQATQAVGPVTESYYDTLRKEKKK